jgi:integrase
MTRTVRESRLETRTARDRLKARPEPHYRTVIPQLLALGYKKRHAGVAGYWVARRYIGEDGRIGAKGSPYRTTTLGLADDFEDPDGERVLSFAQAQEKARERAAPVLVPHEGMSVGEALESYLSHLEKDSKSVGDARSRTRAHILPAFGSTAVGDLTTAAISKWHQKLASTPARVRSPKGAPLQFKKTSDEETSRRRRSTANRTLTVLKAALNFVAKGKHGPAPWRDVKPYASVDTARVRYLAIDEAQRLINASPPAFRLLVRAALATGCRYGELAALNVGDFNPDSRTLHIRTSKSGKGRHVALADEGVGLFERLRAGRASAAPMLERSDGARWISSQQGRPMAEACRKGGVDPSANFHALRHTYASHAIMNGAPLFVVARNLGHSTTVMVEKHYGHLAPSYIADAIRAAAPRFGYEEPDALKGLRAGDLNN